MNPLLADMFDSWKEMAGAAVFILYILGSFASSLKKGKKNKQDKEREKEKRPKPVAARRAPVPPRPPRREPAVVSAPRPVAPRPPEAPGSEIEPVQARPARIVHVRPKVRHAPRKPTRIPAREERAPQRPAAWIQQEPSPPAEPAPVGVEEEAVRPAPEKRRRLSRTDKLDRVLRSRSGLSAAILLSEILAPPVALRENHLD